MSRSTNNPGCGTFIISALILIGIAVWIEGSTALGPWFIWLVAIGYSALYLIGLVFMNTDIAERIEQRQRTNQQRASDHVENRRASSAMGPIASPRKPFRPALGDADLTFGEPASGLQRDDSAKFVTLRASPDEPNTSVRFKCSEFEKPIGTSGEQLWLPARYQHYVPVQVTTHGNFEWWWFRRAFYKVEYQKGRPSADLAADLSVGGSYTGKWSLDGFGTEGYSSDEVAEGVFEMEGKAESGLERADRLDRAETVLMHLQTVTNQLIPLGEQQLSDMATEAEYLESRLEQGQDLDQAQDYPGSYGVEKDTSARIFTDKAWLSTRVYIQSNVHQPRQVLGNNDAQFALVSELQNYHPILVDKKTAQGRLWRSQIVAEWWWFKGEVYLAKREKGFRSKALEALKRNVDLIQTHGKWEAWIPKYTVGNAIEGGYEEGYAPEEVVRHICESQGEPETLRARFERIGSAKTVLSKHLQQEPWDRKKDAPNRRLYQAYLEAKKQEGYRGDYKQWFREQLRRSEEPRPRITGNYSVASKPRREHIPKSVKIHVWQRDQARCVNCGSNEKLEYDHIIPLSKGGSNTERNIQLLCERCNRSKGASIS